MILADIIAGTVNDITNADISIVRLNRKRLFRLTVRYTAGHTPKGKSFIYHAIVGEEDLGKKSLSSIVGQYFKNSYLRVVS